MKYDEKYSAMHSKLASVFFDSMPVSQLQHYYTIHLHKGLLWNIIKQQEGMVYDSLISH